MTLGRAALCSRGAPHGGLTVGESRSFRRGSGWWLAVHCKLDAWPTAAASLHGVQGRSSLKLSQGF